MQHILLPLLVLNLLLTFWLLRQHILRQGSRHRRRNRIDQWLNDIRLEIRGHDQALINHGEIFLEHRSAMTEINKDHYAINERLDGISVYDIKAILAGQERLQTLESDIEAIKEVIKDFITMYGTRLSDLERHDADKFSRISALESEIGTYISESRFKNIESIIRKIQFETNNPSIAISRFDSRLESINDVVKILQEKCTDLGGKFSTLDYLRVSEGSDMLTRINDLHVRMFAAEESLVQHTAKITEFMSFKYVNDGWAASVDREIKAAKKAIATWDFMRRIYEDLDNRIVDLENGAKPFNPDTLIDSILNPDRKVPRGTILLSGDDIIKYGDEICFDPSFDWEEPINSSVGKTVSEVSASIGHTVMVRRTLTPAEDQSPESDRQEDKAYDQLLDKAVKNARPKKQKPGTDYTHDIIP